MGLKKYNERLVIYSAAEVLATPSARACCTPYHPRPNQAQDQQGLDPSQPKSERGFFLFLTATTLSSILPHWLSSSSLVVESEKSHPLPTRVYSDCVPSHKPIFLYPTFTLLYNRLQFIIVQFRHIIFDRSMMEIRS